MRNPRLVLAIIIGIVAVVAIVVGVIYVAEPAHSLPSFFPGHINHGGKHAHSKRGLAGIGVGVVLLIISLWLGLAARRPRHW
jgi:amino acid transporter